MRIGIDLDGTITDFYSSLLKHGVEFGEKNFNNGKIKNYNGFEIWEIFDWTEEEVAIFKEYVRSEMRMGVKPREGSIEVIKELHDLGHKIYIITSRKESDQINCLENTKLWLEKNNVCYDELILGNSNKLEECINHKIDIFVDDKIKHCKKCHDHGIEVFLVDNPYNKDCDLKRVNSFYELRDLIVNR